MNILLRNDADQMVNQGLEEHTLFEVTSGELQQIFTGEQALTYGSVYDVFATFVAN